MSLINDIVLGWWRWDLSARLRRASATILCSLLAAGGITVFVVAFFFTIKFLFELAARIVSFLQHEDRERRGERTIYDYVRGNYLDPRSCKISWDWKDPHEVGHSMAFRVHVREYFCFHVPLGAGTEVWVRGGHFSLFLRVGDRGETSWM